MISGVNGSNSNSAASGPFSSAVSNQFVSQHTFLTLLLTQLKNQDPMNPQDSSQFVSQLAQFSSLEQMSEVSKKMESVLENSVVNMIGHTVTVADSTTQSGYTQGQVSGVVYYADGPALVVNGKSYPLSSVQNVGQ
jgi:flagellar basal-body rod modification protein FlgD